MESGLRARRQAADKSAAPATKAPLCRQEQHVADEINRANQTGIRPQRHPLVR